MNDIDARLRAAVTQLERDVAANTDTEAALARAVASRQRSWSRRNVGPWLVAAAAIAVVGTGIAVAIEPDGVDLVTSATIGQSSATTEAPTAPIAATPTSTTLQPKTTTSLLARADLFPSAPGWEITFDGAAGRNLGDRLEPESVEPFEGQDGCGYWGPQEPNHSVEPQPPSGLATGTLTEPTIISVRVNEPTARTASGVGVGTSVASLQRVYGLGLVIDRADGTESPTDGLLALYQDVAAVKRGDRAITFLLDQEKVVSIKISEAEFWGDDEGCA